MDDLWSHNINEKRGLRPSFFIGNNSLDWKHLKKVTGIEWFSLPSNLRELSITVFTSDYLTVVPYNIPIWMFGGANALLPFTLGSAINGSACVYSRVDIDKPNNRMRLGALIVNGVEYTNSSGNIDVWYR